MSDLAKAIERYEPKNDIAQAGVQFAELVNAVSRTLGSDASKTVYGQTYRAWLAWCDENGVNYFDLRPVNVVDFLADGDTSKATRQRQLSAMRKLAQMLVILDGEEARRLYEGLKLIKAPKSDKKRRADRALQPSEADAMLRVWADTDALSRRNDAIIRLLTFTGMRRSELATLRWQDIDLERGVVQVIGGKGDKDRTVAIMDSTGNTVAALQAWRQFIPEYDHVFVSVGRNGIPETDAPVNDKTVARVVKATAKQAGIGELATHDLRRTHLTELMASGGTLAEAQEQAGHAHGSTTLRYAKSVNAEQRRQNARFRFGAVPVPDVT